MKAKPIYKKLLNGKIDLWNTVQLGLLHNFQKGTTKKSSMFADEETGGVFAIKSTVYFGTPCIDVSMMGTGWKKKEGTAVVYWDYDTISIVDVKSKRGKWNR